MSTRYQNTASMMMYVLCCRCISMHTILSCSGINSLRIQNEEYKTTPRRICCDPFCMHETYPFILISLLETDLSILDSLIAKTSNGFFPALFEAHRYFMFPEAMHIKTSNSKTF